MNHPESSLQRTCIRLWRLRHREFGVPDHRLLNSVPNGGKRNVVTAVIMKAEGQIRGFPDLELQVPMAPYHGLKIEMKVPGGSLSPDQREMISLLRTQGYDCRVAHSVDEFFAAIKDYLHR